VFFRFGGKIEWRRWQRVSSAKVCTPNKSGVFRTGIFSFPGISMRGTCDFLQKTMESIKKGVINAQEACFQRTCDDVIILPLHWRYVICLGSSGTVHFPLSLAR
jgi:hypothetical protein